MLQEKDIYYDWSEIVSLFGASSLLTAIIYVFISI
jgi:hypothetical protein